ncbi:hypothetical protein XH89_31955 [Bradyrhizobium sp. CCBAU 53340]|uniref:hypothetical protein n=1 Tax=Bradyrhizobium sp. CCBAU 53340 TaxID=1325112 RepID=UPI00188AE818|nr:hypothetical protein [Bradyrhizobium sp. CCBAU 53340]QOZ47590.1 hypothetical protein XH89_31955 [Bradyrhizobium sp. CCBAU 53340]
MSKLTAEQIAFAKTMSIKQRSVLRTLDNFPFYLSASERADREIDDLFRNKLVQCCHYDSPAGSPRALPAWGVTQAGKAVVARLEKGQL